MTTSSGSITFHFFVYFEFDKSLSVFLISFVSVASGIQSLELQTYPSFDTQVANVTVTEGTTAVLPCQVTNLGSKQVNKVLKIDFPFDTKVDNMTITVYIVNSSIVDR